MLEEENMFLLDIKNLSPKQILNETRNIILWNNFEKWRIK